MDIRLLGPLHVLADDGTPLPVTAPGPRAVLSALALRAGRAVPAGELAAQVWGGEPSAGAGQALRDGVAGLIAVVPGGRIREVPGGYLLRAGREETDLGRFQDALRLARELAARAPGRAVGLLDEALGLWRGAPLADLAECPLRAREQPRLAELRLVAVEERFDLLLALGEHAAVVDDVAAESGAHPLRERLIRQAVIARHRCGRTAEALTAYRNACARLAAAGAGPSPELRDLERAVLRADPRPAAPAVRRAGPARREPSGPTAAFPPGTATFVARGRELGRIRGWLTHAVAGPAVCLIDGPGGVGKSTLAVRAAREVADRFPDGLLHVDLRGADPRDPPLDAHEARLLLLAALGTPGSELPRDPAAAGAFYREQLAGRRVLLLLDNALDAGQVAPLLPAGPGSAALVTSRTPLTGIGPGHRLRLAALTVAEAVTFVRAIAGGAAERGTRREWEELVTLCGRLPLALRIVATRMAARPCRRVAEWTAVLADERRRTDELTADDLDVRASLMVSIDQLAAGTEPDHRLAAGMFPLLGAAAVRSYSPGAVAALVGCPAGEARRALDRLTDAQIAGSPRPGVYTLHDLVRSAAAWQAARLPRERATGRLAELARWYLGSLYRVNEPLALPEHYRGRYRAGAGRFPRGRRFTSVDESLPWVDEVLEDVIALARQLAAPEYDAGEELAGRPLSAFALESVRALETYFGTRLSWRGQRRLCEITLQVGERRGDRFAQAVAYGQLGKAAGQQGDGIRGVELLHRGIALCRSVGERAEALAMTLNLVPCLGSAGKLAEAVEVAERTLAEVRAAGIEEFRPQLVNNLARCHLFLGHHAKAHELLSRNYESAPLPYERTIAAGVLAEYHLETGEFEEAARWSGRALSHAAEQPFDPFVVAQHRTWLAAALRGLGREEAARAEETRAQAVLRDLNSRENSHLRVRVDEKYAM
ncbi:BTAD domain-containing putative transcriptional regulator [Streptomyces sp. URMC 129]|uniref:AfsR/SARP family transcriptional regulator n=1 Tax=Streptomyces sp. URMC 129 TaxID=3423407 RepID=UPI003F1C3679